MRTGPTSGTRWKRRYLRPMSEMVGAEWERFSGTIGYFFPEKTAQNERFTSSRAW